jgi:hypothetical protein
MRSKLVFSALVVASLFGATAIASAQTEPTAGAPAAAKGTGSKMAHHGKITHHRMSSYHRMRYSRAAMDKSRPGGQPISRNPPD